MSPLTQGRGLKLALHRLLSQYLKQSPLTQGRGLKLVSTLFYMQTKHVAPHAGAWIETRPLALGNKLRLCRPSRRGVD